MAYYVGAYSSNYHYDEYKRKIERIREYESSSRDERARIMMEEVKRQRIEQNKPSPRDPILVSRKMKQLPKPGIY